MSNQINNIDRSSMITNINNQIWTIQWELWFLNNKLEQLTNISKIIEKQLINILTEISTKKYNLERCKENLSNILVKDILEIKNSIEEKEITKKSLENQLEEVWQEIENYNLELNENTISLNLLSQMSVLMQLRENDPNIDKTINDKRIDEIIELYNDELIPDNIKDKFFLFKGPINTWKNTAVNTIANGINRPLYKIQYKDYINEVWLWGYFEILINYIRQQSIEKNQTREEYNQIDNILKTKDENYDEFIEVISEIEFSDELWKPIKIDITKEKNLESAISILKNQKQILQETINNYEDSCILCIDDLDKILQQSKFEKWDLIAPISDIIDNIKKEWHDIIVILCWNNLWPNNHKFKWLIDRTLTFNNIWDNYINILNNILEEYSIKNDLEYDRRNKINIDIPKEYRNNQFFSKLAKRITQYCLIKKCNIDNHIIQLEFNKLKEEQKEMYTRPWFNLNN